MDPQQSPPPQPTLEPSQPMPNSLESEPESAKPPHKSHKKLFIIGGVIVVIFIIVGTGLSVWVIQNHNQQLAVQAELEATQQLKTKELAKARAGTVSDLQKSLDSEFKQAQDLDGRYIYNSGESLKQEASAAAVISTGGSSGF